MRGGSSSYWTAPTGSRARLELAASFSSWGWSSVTAATFAGRPWMSAPSVMAADRFMGTIRRPGRTS